MKELEGGIRLKGEWEGGGSDSLVMGEVLANEVGEVFYLFTFRPVSWSL